MYTGPKQFNSQRARPCRTTAAPAVPLVGRSDDATRCIPQWKPYMETIENFNLILHHPFTALLRPSPPLSHSSLLESPPLTAALDSNAKTPGTAVPTGSCVVNRLDRQELPHLARPWTEQKFGTPVLRSLSRPTRR